MTSNVDSNHDHNHNQVRIVFMGTPAFAVVILARLLDSAYKPLLVITEPDKPVGRKQIVTPPPVKTFARAAGLPVSQPASRDELLVTLGLTKPDLVIVAAYGRILTQAMIDLPSHGILNVHTSLLPKYRGASPIQAAILAGDSETGVTIMQIDAGLDTGPILASQTVPIKPEETTPTLTDKLAEVGGDLLVRTLPSYLDGSLQPQPQPSEGTSITSLLTKDSGRLTGTESPTQVLRMLQAYLPWPGVWAEVGGERILLLAAHEDHGQLMPERVQLASKNPVSWETFNRDRRPLADQFLRFLNQQ